MKRSLLFLMACSNVNQQSQDEFNKKEKFRHGIIPQETFGPKDLGFKKEFTKKYTNDLRDKMNKSAADRGKILYEKHCLSCHGESGKGDGPDSKFLKIKPSNLSKTVREVPHFKFYMSISQWEGNMPGWKTHFTEVEREELVAYIQSFK